MARQNRVTPFGDIISVPARGTLMGNRGCLHDDQQQLGRKRWTRLPWITCQLEFQGRRRTLMQPGRYTELFFLDEVTALAAGHRPCWECRREAYERFRDAWARGNGRGDERMRAADFDTSIHSERVAEQGAKRTYQARLADLPAGTFITDGDRAFLIWNGALFPWSPTGYAAPTPLAGERLADVLTPRSVVNALLAGYKPAVHSSIETLGGL